VCVLSYAMGKIGEFNGKICTHIAKQLAFLNTDATQKPLVASNNVVFRSGEGVIGLLFLEEDHR
jgi:hypothetical protein